MLLRRDPVQSKPVKENWSNKTDPAASCCIMCRDKRHQSPHRDMLQHPVSTLQHVSAHTVRSREARQAAAEKLPHLLQHVAPLCFSQRLRPALRRGGGTRTQPPLVKFRGGSVRERVSPLRVTFNRPDAALELSPIPRPPLSSPPPHVLPHPTPAPIQRPRDAFWTHTHTHTHTHRWVARGRSRWDGGSPARTLPPPKPSTHTRARAPLTTPDLQTPSPNTPNKPFPGPTPSQAAALKVRVKRIELHWHTGTLARWHAGRSRRSNCAAPKFFDHPSRSPSAESE